MPQTQRFADFELRPAERVLLRAGQPLPLGSRAFDLLLALVQAQGALVTKDELLAQAWPGLIVEEANVHVQVSLLRKLLGPQAIATVAGLGYRFALPLDAERVRHNLPAQRSAFIARTGALVEAEQRLGGTRLLTLIGIGGTGKTRLALQLAERVLPRYADGVWWVDLSPLDRAEHLAPAIAQALNLRLHPGADPVPALAGQLTGGPRLLVLDNCEHLLDAAAAIVDSLLTTAPQLQVLATSREALALAGETVLPVRPLGLPGPGATADDAEQAEAVQLFALRAEQVMPSFVLDSSNWPVVAELCRRLDGLPLALELAAAQLRVVAPAQVLALLQQQLLLQAGPRRAQSRQQTLQAVIRWSVDQLHSAEQHLLGALAVCAGGCDLAAAQAIAAPTVAPGAVMDGLARLAALSLVSVEQGGAVARYHLLETVRQFMLDRLHAVGTAHALRNHHALHFLALAEAHDDEITRQGTGAQTLARLSPEQDNLLHALTWCDRARDDEHDADADPVHTGLRLVMALRHYWPSRGQAVTGLRVTEAALARATGRQPDTAQLWAQVARIQYLGQLGDDSAALQAARDLLVAARAANDAIMEGSAHAQIGDRLARLGRGAEAEPELQAALALARAQKQSKREGDALGGLSLLATVRGDAARADALNEQVLAIRRQAGHGYHLATALLNATLLAQNLDDDARAWQRLAEATALLPRVGSQYLSQLAVDLAVALLGRAGDWPAAVVLAAASSAHRHDSALPLKGGDFDDRQTLLRQARGAIGDEAFEVAWAEGLALDQPGAQARVAATAEKRPT